MWWKILVIIFSWKKSVCPPPPRQKKGLFVWGQTVGDSLNLSKIFPCQNKKSELSIDGSIMYFRLSNFDVDKPQNIFCEIGPKTYPARTFEFRLIYDTFREAKFKSVLRVLFSRTFTKIFCAFSTSKFKSLTYIWLTHQSKALIFYFGMKKILILIFEKFGENRQSRLDELEFSVCLHTF